MGLKIHENKNFLEWFHSTWSCTEIQCCKKKFGIHLSLHDTFSVVKLTVFKSAYMYLMFV